MAEHIEAYKQIRVSQNSERKQLREECLSSVSELCTTMLHDVRSGVAKIYTNQKKIKDATLELQQSSQQFNQKIERWIKKYNSLNSSLRGLGDIRNWAQAIKSDLQEINENLEEIVDFKKDQIKQMNNSNNYDNTSIHVQQNDNQLQMR